MAPVIDIKGRVNFSDVGVLLLDQSDTAVDLMAQIFAGFGARNCHKATSVEEACRIVGHKSIDLALVEQDLGGETGVDFVRWLRRAASEPSRSTPVLLTTTATTETVVKDAIAAGVHFVIAKPLSGSLLMKRIAWILRDNRPFVECDAFVGPERRVRMLGPPAGMAGRRSTDIKTRLGEAQEPNLSQSDIDTLIKPQRVAL